MEPSEDQLKGSRLTFAYGIFRWIKRGEQQSDEPQPKP